MIEFLKEKLLGERRYFIKRIDRNGQILFVKTRFLQEKIMDLNEIIETPSLLQYFEKSEQKKLSVLAKHRKLIWWRLIDAR